MVYKVEHTTPRYFSKITWCIEQFGPEGQPQWEKYKGIDIARGLRWWRRQGHIFFRSEKDYAFYCLRWS
jgi:hypothetical protein